uniref:Uncharacterized protein n=1 Tax=Podarcis muralis TaxID=64176 RepID=A0A670IBA5_PODMU
MGQSLSAPQQKFFDELKFLLASNNLVVLDADLKALIQALDTHCPWYAQDATLDLKNWEKVGHSFHNHPQIDVKVLDAWCKVYKAMSSLTPANILLAACSTLPVPPVFLAPPSSLSLTLPSSANPPVYAPPKPPDLPPSAPPAPPPPLPKASGTASTPLQESLRAAAPLLAFDSTTPNLFPVIAPATLGGGPARHDQFDLRFIKELYSSVKDNGPAPPAPIMLTQTDVLDGLTGGGNFLTIAQQLALDPMYWAATTAAAQEALSSVPDDKTERNGRWGSVRQNPTEPYGQFVDRLYNTLKRQVQDVAAQELIVRQLAFDNANEDCKQALRPLMTTPNIVIADVLKACQSVGTESYKARLLATALSFTVSQNPAKDKTCFGCGKVGYFRAQCRSTAQQRHSSTKCPIFDTGQDLSIF